VSEHGETLVSLMLTPCGCDLREGASGDAQSVMYRSREEGGTRQIKSMAGCRSTRASSRTTCRKSVHALELVAVCRSLLFSFRLDSPWVVAWPCSRMATLEPVTGLLDMARQEK
jgi:hypothetical protein